MSVNLTFEIGYFETKIEGFETSRRSYASSSSNKKKTNKLPKKVSISFKVPKKANNTALRFILLNKIALNWRTQMCFFRKKIALMKLWNCKLIVHMLPMLMQLKSFWMKGPQHWHWNFSRSVLLWLNLCSALETPHIPRRVQRMETRGLEKKGIALSWKLQGKKLLNWLKRTDFWKPSLISFFGCWWESSANKEFQCHFCGPDR